MKLSKIYIFLHGVEVRWLHHKFRAIVPDALIQSLLESVGQVVFVGVHADRDCQLNGEDNCQESGVLCERKEKQKVEGSELIEHAKSDVSICLTK